MDAHRPSPLSPRLWRVLSAVLALAAIGAIGYLALWTDDPRVRYAQMRCGYTQIYRTAGPIDVVLLGSSRMKFGVDSRSLAEDLGLDPEAAAIVNMGRPGRGTGQMYQQLLDAERERGIAGPIVIEYSPSDAPVFGRESLYYHYLPSYPATVTFRSLAADWRSKPREPAYAKAHDLLQQVRYKLDTGLETALLGRAERNRYQRPERRAVKGVQTCVNKPRVPEEQLKRNPKSAEFLREREASVAREVGPDGSWRDLPPLQWDVDVVNQDRQGHYIEQVLRFGEERGVPVLAVLFPGYLEAQPDPQIAIDFERRFGIPLHYPSLELREQLNADDGYYYRDRNHLNRRGWKLYTAWLAGLLQEADPALGAPPPEPRAR